MESFKNSELDESSNQHWKLNKSPVNKVPVFSSSTRGSWVYLKVEENKAIKTIE